VLVSFAEADWISHWSKTASVKPASKQNLDLFGLFATLRPSTVDDKVGLARPESKTACQYRDTTGVLPIGVFPIGVLPIGILPTGAC
jgi:hypothetical protein